MVFLDFIPRKTSYVLSYLVYISWMSAVVLWSLGYMQGPVHAYVAVPGGKTSYLSELKAGKEVVIVDQNGIQRTAIVGRLKIETRQLIIIEAKVRSLLTAIIVKTSIAPVNLSMETMCLAWG